MHLKYQLKFSTPQELYELLNLLMCHSLMLCFLFTKQHILIIQNKLFHFDILYVHIMCIHLHVLMISISITLSFLHPLITFFLSINILQLSCSHFSFDSTHKEKHVIELLHSFIKFLLLCINCAKSGILL